MSCTIPVRLVPESVMSGKPLLSTLGLALLLAGLAGCASKKAAIYEHEHFDDSGTFSRAFSVNEASSCEAARRALLSQGYIITSSSANQVAGNKSFQQNSENHLQISFNITCAPDSADTGGSTLFANALQDRYSLKKSNTSASLGVGVLGSVSMPIGSSDDSMVKVASETVTAPQFYERYFALVESYLPKPRKVAAKAAPVDPPAAAPSLGLPGPAATSLAPEPVSSVPAVAPVETSRPETSTPVPEVTQATAVESPAVDSSARSSQSSQDTQVAAPAVTDTPTTPAASVPASDEQQGSQPIAPPADAAPIQVQEPEPTPETAPPAPAPAPTPTSAETPGVSP